MQRRCYWLLDADEDIVLVHYLSARQLTGGPRSKGGPSRAAASQDTTSVEARPAAPPHKHVLIDWSYVRS